MRLALALACLSLAACAPFDPARLPESEEWIVAVKSCKLPPEVTCPVDLAHHGWFDLKEGSEDEWRRLEVITTEAFTDDDVLKDYPIDSAEARRDVRWERDVHLLTVVTGEDARRMIADLHRQADAYEDRANYRGWAGPNSNTFVDRLVRGTPGLRVEHHHNAVGKDYTPLIRIGPTTTGTGLELDTYLFGIQIGLEEGIEVHFLNLTFGIDLFPPAIKLPFAPRLGFPDPNFFD